MFDLLRKTFVGLAAVVALGVGTAGAAVVQMTPTFTDVGVGGGGPYDISAPNTVYRFGNQHFAGADAPGALFGFEFNATGALPQPTSTTVTLNLLGEFIGFVMAWSDDAVLDAGDTYFPAPSLIISGIGGTALGYTFTSVPKYLIVTYDSVSDGGDLDIRVSAVPLPAGGLLLIGALGGLAALRRRRKMA